MISSRKKLVVIGGGAAGFFCAINAARLNPSLSVVMVERTGKLLSKVKVSGGGRCNVTHHCFDIVEMSRRYPRGGHFVKRIFHQFFTTDTISWFEERGVSLKAEADGRMFPVTNSSQTIIDCLMREASKYGVEVMMNAEVRSLQHTTDQWHITFANNSLITANYVCIASGGYPKSGMFEWIRQTGHSIEAPVPSLFTFNMPNHSITRLMGVSVEHARVKIQGSKLEQEGPLLITHWGMSGPAILKLSAWGARELADKEYNFSIVVNWLPPMTEQQLAEQMQSIRYSMAAQKTGSKNPFGLPQRLWEYLLEYTQIDGNKRWSDLPAKDMNRLVKNLAAFECSVKGKTTFKEEFVTAGGILLNEIDANTLMSKKHDQLYFAGEVIDVDGITGGYNFQHAWTTGWIVAHAIAKNNQ